MTWGFYFDVERQENFSFENTIFLNELTEEEKVAIFTNIKDNNEITKKETTQEDKKQDQINKLIEKNIREYQGRDIFENTLIKIAACIYLIYIIY
jgi:hypothetical protein